MTGMTMTKDGVVGAKLLGQILAKLEPCDGERRFSRVGVCVGNARNEVNGQRAEVLGTEQNRGVSGSETVHYVYTVSGAITSSTRQASRLSPKVLKSTTS